MSLLRLIISGQGSLSHSVLVSLGSLCVGSVVLLLEGATLERSMIAFLAIVGALVIVFLLGFSCCAFLYLFFRSDRPSSGLDRP